MRRRADLTRRPDDPRGLLLSEHPHQNTRPRPVGPLDTPGEVWGTCVAKPDGFSEHFGCRGEYREQLVVTDDGGQAQGAWRVCACWCHYLLELDRMPPRRRCGCGRPALQDLGVLWAGISEWEARSFCRACLAKRREHETMEVELRFPSGGPELGMPWIRGRVNPLSCMNYENNWRARLDTEMARRCPAEHGRRPTSGCDWCQAHWFRHCLTLDITWYGRRPLPEALAGNPVAAGPKDGMSWQRPAATPALAEAVAGGDQAALF
jgi:hypothetical protein